jgi:lysophospholipase L1-like esterase
LKPTAGFDAKFEGYYRQNVETLIAINRARGVKVGFIGQLLNYPRLAAQHEGQRAFAAPAVQDRDIPAAMEHLNGVLAETATAHSVPYLAPSQDWLKADDYTDFGHFSVSGARIFADKVADFVKRTCSEQ